MRFFGKKVPFSRSEIVCSAPGNLSFPGAEHFPPRSRALSSSPGKMFQVQKRYFRELLASFMPGKWK
ncbi:hypothetical protein VCM39_22490 [Bacteroides sp. CG01]|uniref:hypothetical protein n=1 Tax=Bacteroides sp. CG01 TaxID=3096000 RepID=UPI002AFDDA09|nr:hypothetical protein [Bacteroides sp. CG01]